MDLKALEEEILQDIHSAPANIKKLTDFITSVKGSRIESMLERFWPGLAAAEEAVLLDLQKLSALDEQLILWLDKLFPNPAKPVTP